MRRTNIEAVGERGLRGARTWAAAAAVAAGLLLVSAGAAETILSHPISDDPYTNTNGDVQHKTQVEPDSFAFGDTIVTLTQSGRYVNGGGASNLVFSTSQDGGRTWTTGGLPGTTVWEGGPWPRISDPSIAYDPQDDVWLALGLGIDAGGSGHVLLVNRSTDDGLSLVEPGQCRRVVGDLLGQDLDHLRHVGREPALRQLLHPVRRQQPGQRHEDGHIDRRRSHLGAGSRCGLFLRARRPACRAAERQRHRSVLRKRRSAVLDPLDRRRHYMGWVHAHHHRERARCRRQHAVFSLPSAEVAGDGRVYVAWQDCRFRSGCPANDIVYSSSLDGLAWSAVTRIPIDPTNSNIDHFLPGIAVDKATSGARPISPLATTSSRSATAATARASSRSASCRRLTAEPPGRPGGR